MTPALNIMIYDIIALVTQTELEKKVPLESYGPETLDNGSPLIIIFLV